MTQKEVQILLDSGVRLGMTKQVDSPDYLGWILVSKHSPHPRITSILQESKQTHLLEEQRQRQLAPYLVLIIELKRSIHEAGDYETENDYRMKVKTWCKDIAQVQAVLSGLGMELRQFTRVERN